LELWHSVADHAIARRARMKTVNYTKNQHRRCASLRQRDVGRTMPLLAFGALRENPAD
jgi:hypothetical protein